MYNLNKIKLNSIIGKQWKIPEEILQNTQFLAVTSISLKKNCFYNFFSDKIYQ